MMSALAPADAFCARARSATPFSSAIKRVAREQPLHRWPRAPMRRRACPLSHLRACVSRATPVVLIYCKDDVGLFFAVLCIYSRGRFRSAVCPGS
jgi:hypothetical protein